MAHVRWWATQIDRAGVVPSNGALGIANREYVTNEDKSQVLDSDKLALVKDAHVAMALRLETAFGLRSEEAIKFTPARDDRGDRIRLKGSTTKGGRRREVPILKDSQRNLLDEARRLAGGGTVPDAWIETCVQHGSLRGTHRVEGAGGGRAAVADGGEEAHRHGGAARDRGGTRPF